MSAAVLRHVGPPTPGAGEAPHVGLGSAFIAEVRMQRAQALDQLEQAAATLDDWALSAVVAGCVTSRRFSTATTRGASRAE